MKQIHLSDCRHSACLPSPVTTTQLQMVSFLLHRLLTKEEIFKAALAAALEVVR